MHWEFALGSQCCSGRGFALGMEVAGSYVALGSQCCSGEAMLLWAGICSGEKLLWGISLGS
ncbi:MAG TPA: hypothetical protein PLR86_05990 [Planctomycetota bacterium]|nr:hypothetical protein [Planctomycetota bacterium]